jgi:hypothetical protein
MTPWGAQFARHISSSDGGYPAYRFAVILDTGNLPPRNAIHPAEADIKQEAVPGAEVTTANFSYAMLRLDAEGRLAEWRETINPDAPVLSDRMIGTVASPQSVWTQPGEGRWAGHVIFNDGRAEWIDAASPVIRNTRYGDGATVAVDHLFMPDDADAKGNTDTNAAMVFATDRDHENQK